MHTIQFYNTLTKKKENFKSIVPKVVKLYICGVTVYDQCHLGHARGGINFDVLRNLLETLDFDVTYVKNYTDIDDKIIQRANEKQISPKELSEKMIQAHDQDMISLGIRPPDIAPKATEHISEMIALIQTLITKEVAYEINGNVFFRVRCCKNYGKLSGKKIDDLKSGIRVEIDDKKEESLDFALWKAAKPGEPTWESPWGLGRPGWHIECSAMANKYLGNSFDIHAGGSDLIFPHHENEIAQSECASQKTYANYWLHNGMIQIQGEKMSKSLGNFATIQNLLQEYHPELLRFYLISTQYRQTLDFQTTLLETALQSLDRIYKAFEVMEQKYESSFFPFEPQAVSLEVKNQYNLFLSALCDDLNTPKAIGILFDITKQLNLNLSNEQLAKQYAALLRKAGSILGILKLSGIKWFESPRLKKNSTTLTNQEIEDLICKRNEARKNKNWQLADEIRNSLKKESIILEDRDGKTFWSKK